MMYMCTTGQLLNFSTIYGETAMCINVIIIYLALAFFLPGHVLSPEDALKIQSEWYR